MGCELCVVWCEVNIGRAAGKDLRRQITRRLTSNDDDGGGGGGSQTDRIDWIHPISIVKERARKLDVRVRCCNSFIYNVIIFPLLNYSAIEYKRTFSRSNHHKSNLYSHRRNSHTRR